MDKKAKTKTLPPPGSYVAGDWLDNIVEPNSTFTMPTLTQSKIKKKKPVSKALKHIKEDLAKGGLDVYDDLGELDGIDTSDLQKHIKVLTEKTMVDSFKAYSKGLVVEHPKILSPGEMVEIGAKTIHVLKKENKKIKRIERTFKMSDFKFPSVKRVNTRLAQKTLKVGLGEDILEAIEGLKI